MKREFYRILSCALLSVASCVILQAIGQTREIPSLQTQALNTFLKNLLEGTFEEKSLPALLESIPVELKERLNLEEEIKQRTINQGEPVKSYNTDVGHVTEFTNGSIRIDDYLRIDNTFYLSGDLQRYLQTDASGNIILNSLDKKLVRSTPFPMYKFPHAIISEYLPSSLKLIYPENYEVQFSVIPFFNKKKYIINADNHPLLVTLHEAITKLNKNTVAQILHKLYSEERAGIIPELVNYIFVTDDALHRAIKKGLTATGSQLNDAKTIIKMLILAGADSNKPNIDGKTALQLAANNPELRKVMQQAPLWTQAPALQKDLLDAINQQDKAQVENIIKRAQNRGILDDLLNISIGTEDIPLVAALKPATFSGTSEPAREAYLDIAQLLINNGATLNNFYGKKFLDRYGKEYREKLAPYLNVK